MAQAAFSSSETHAGKGKLSQIFSCTGGLSPIFSGNVPWADIEEFDDVAYLFDWSLWRPSCTVAFGGTGSGQSVWTIQAQVEQENVVDGTGETLNSVAVVPPTQSHHPCVAEQKKFIWERRISSCCDRERQTLFVLSCEAAFWKIEEESRNYKKKCRNARKQVQRRRKADRLREVWENNLAVAENRNKCTELQMLQQMEAWRDIEQQTTASRASVSLEPAQDVEETCHAEARKLKEDIFFLHRQAKTSTVPSATIRLRGRGKKPAAVCQTLVGTAVQNVSGKQCRTASACSYVPRIHCRKAAARRIGGCRVRASGKCRRRRNKCLLLAVQKVLPRRTAADLSRCRLFQNSSMSGAFSRAERWNVSALKWFLCQAKCCIQVLEPETDRVFLFGKRHHVCCGSVVWSSKEEHVFSVDKTSCPLPSPCRRRSCRFCPRPGQFNCRSCRAVVCDECCGVCNGCDKVLCFPSGCMAGHDCNDFSDMLHPPWLRSRVGGRKPKAVESWLSEIEVYAAWKSKHASQPSRESSDAEEKKLATWLNNIRARWNVPESLRERWGAQCPELFKENTTGPAPS